MDSTISRPQDGSYSRKRQRQPSLPPASPRELGQMRKRRDTGPGSASFVGSASGIYFVRTVRQAFAKNSHSQNHVENATNDEELVPGEDDRLHNQTTHSNLWRPNEVLFMDQDENRCQFDDLVQWTRSYFDSWHPLFPFLHAPTVLGALERLSLNGLGQLDHTEMVITRAIMSISLADRRQLPKHEDRPVPAQLIFQTTDEALSAIQLLIARPSTLPSLQAVVSVQLFLISMLRLNAASRIGGVIVRMAFHLGLHRCPTRFVQFSASDAEMRRRVFWSIYSLERYLSQSLGLPLDLRDDDLDVCYPDKELHSLGKTPSATEITNVSQLLLLTSLSKHGRVKGLILELRNKSVLHTLTDPDDIAHIDAEISKWWNEVQDFLDPSLDMFTSLGGDLQNGESISLAPPLKPSHKLLLIVQKHESVILLNRPVLTSGYNTSAFPAALQRCIGAAKAIISNIYRHLSEGVKLAPAQNGRIDHPLIWPGFVWSVWQSGLILLYAASEGHYSSRVSQRESSRCISILENLALRGNVWPNSCASVIRELQTALSNNLNTNSTHIPLDLSASCHIQSPLSDELQYGGNTQSSTDENRNASRSRLDHVASLPVSTERLDITRPESHQTDNQRNFISSVGDYSSLSPDELSRDFGRTDLPTGPQAQFPYHAQPGSIQRHASGYSTNNDFEVWPSTNGISEVSNRLQDDLYDIFQLMDTSYVLSGQISAAQPELFGAIGNVSQAHQNM